MQVETTTSTELLRLVPFELGSLRCAVDLRIVERVLQSVSVTPLPGAPAIVLGIVNIHGKIVPVIALGRRFGLPDREIALSDRLLVAEIPPLSRESALTVALLVDSVGPVIEVRREDIVAADALVAGLEHVQGVARLPDGLLLIHDLDGCLSLTEKRAITTAIETSVNE